jgi:DNA helicase-2/ATP-dependent DNA helicase PcrA
VLDLFPPTEQQLAVIEHRGANLLVLAGPGTGKTETLARRFASLVAGGAGAHQILVLTFSRRAADEMRDRVLLRLRQSQGASLAVSELFVKTFHSFCGRLLDGDRVRARERSLLTPVKERLLWRRLMREGKIAFESFDESVAASPQFATDCLNVIGQLKGRGIGADDVKRFAGEDPRLRDLALVYRLMEEQRLALDLHDYRDLVNEAERALRDAASPASEWLLSAGFRHVLVDEFQDSDRMQLELLERLRAAISPEPAFCFVGDTNQSIYRFRGASPENVDLARRRFDCQILELRDNRRSAQAILDVANADPTLAETSKTRAADQARRGAVRFERPRTVEDEVQCIYDAVAGKVASGTDPSAIAVLLRESRPYQELVIEALREAGIPVAAQPTAGFHADGLVDAALTALRLLAAPRDIALWTRLLVNPIVGYLPIAVRLAFDVGRRDRIADPIDMLARTPPAGIRPMRDFIAAWRRCQAAFAQAGPREVLATIARECDLLGPVREQRFVEGFDPNASPARLDALLEAAADHEELAMFVGSPSACAGFVENLDETIGLLADSGQPPPAATGGVRVISIHAAKGLEFDFVAIPQALEGTLPAGMRPNRLLPKRSVERLRRGGADIFVDDDAARTEEHSLWYVALTRARSDVLVTAAQVDDEGVDLLPSSFTKAIEPAEIQVHAAIAEKRPRSDNGAAGASRTEPPPGIVIPIEALSPTSISRFIECPRRFFYGEVLRLPRRGEEATRYGQVLHDLLARFHETETDFETETDAQRIIARCRTTLRALFAAAGERPTAPLARYEAEDLERKLEEYVELLAHQASVEPFRVIARELVVSSALEGLTIHGRVDRVDRLKSGALVIRDYKAGRRHGTALASAVRRSLDQLDAGENLYGEAPKGLNVQTLLYVPGVEAHFKSRVGAVEYVYFRGKSADESTVFFDRTAIVDAQTAEGDALTRSDLERCRRDVAAEIARRCRNGSISSFTTTIDEWQCGYCEFASICPGAGAIPA